MPDIIESFGIACFRQIHGEMQVLTARRRTTYEFSEIASVRYNSRTLPHDIFDRMSIEEKIDIMSLDFSRIWYRAHLETNLLDTGYIRRKTKFERAFLLYGGAKLKARIMASSCHNIPEIWELPKGRRALSLNRKSFKESTLETAIREFAEETGIIKTQYRLYPEISRTYCFIDANVTYKYTYYFAIAYANTTAAVLLSNIVQIKEISAIQWMALNHISIIAIGAKTLNSRSIAATRLISTLTPLFKLARRILRGRIRATKNIII